MGVAFKGKKAFRTTYLNQLFDESKKIKEQPVSTREDGVSSILFTAGLMP